MGRGGWPAALAVLAGCTGEGETLAPSPAEIVDGSTVAGFEPLAGAGVGPYRAQLRSLNPWGVPVPAKDVSVVVDGESRLVSLDNLGYGGVAVSGTGAHTVEVDGVTATVHVFASGWPGVGGSTAFVPPITPGAVLGVTGGVVGWSGAEVWFVGDDMPAHRVLKADADLLGVRALEVDVDGRTDLVAWTSSQVFVLRGHTGGGFGWGTSFRARGLTVAGVDAGDLTGDRIPDLAIAWVQPDGRGVLDVWEQVGVFRFEAAEPRNMPGKPTSITVADANADGIAQVTALHDDGTWSRYLRGAEKQYIPVGPSLPQALLIPPGAVLERCGDANGDAAAEVVVASPPTPDQPRDFWFLDIDTDPLECEAGLPGAQCLTEYVSVEGLLGGDAVCADANADAVDELWLWDREAGLRLYAFDPFTDSFRTEVLDFPFGSGPFDASDRDGDRTADPVVATDRAWSQWYGAPPTEAEGIWSVRRELSLHVRDDVTTPFARTETDGDPATVEWVTTTATGTATYLRVVQYVPLAGGAPILGGTELADTAVAVTDVAVCGTNAYAVAGGEVVRVDLTDPLAPAVAARSGAAVERVACGSGPAGASVVTVDAAGTAELRNQALAVVATADGTFGDAAFADLGDGPETIGCEPVGCRVAAWDSGAGVYVASGDADTLTLALDGVDTPLPGAGEPQVVDLDGDGRPDLAAWDPARRRLTVVRSDGSGITPPVLVNLTGTYTHVAWADGDGDGVPDLFGTDPEGEDLVHTVLVEPPDSTGGTGSTGSTTN